MKKLEYVIRDEIGIHARPAGELVKEAKKYNSIYPTHFPNIKMTNCTKANTFKANL